MISDCENLKVKEETEFRLERIMKNNAVYNIKDVFVLEQRCSDGRNIDSFGGDIEYCSFGFSSFCCEKAL